MPPKFIELADRKGFINADRVAAIRHAPDHHGWLLFDRDGQELGEAAPGFHPDTLDDDAAVMPAASGETATVLHYTGKPEHRPERGDIAMAKCAIIAWRIHSSGWAEPVLVGEPDEPNLTLVRRPDGRMADPYGDDFANIAEATTTFLHAAQEAWDHREGEDAEDPAPPPHVH